MTSWIQLYISNDIFFPTVGLFSTSISMFQFCSWPIRMFITGWEKYIHTAYLCIYGLFDAHFANRGNPYTLSNNSCYYEHYPRAAGQCGPCPEMIHGGSVVLVILSVTWHMHYYAPLYIKFIYFNTEIQKGIPGLTTDSSFSVWGRRRTTCLLPAWWSTFMFLNYSWCVSLIGWREISIYCLPLFLSLYITQVFSSIFPLQWLNS